MNHFQIMSADISQNHNFDVPTEKSIKRFAQSWIDRIFTPDFNRIGLRFFLAGGVYKSLVHKRPPRDLDFWCEDYDSRNRLIVFLRQRGRECTSSPGAQRFIVNDIKVEVSFQVEIMEARLERFDLGLACVAVAYRAGTWVSFVHPLFYQTLIENSLKLVQCHYSLALATIVRTRRYAQDMGYPLPQPIEKQLWNLHLSLEPEMRYQQIEQLKVHYAGRDYEVIQDAKAKLIGF